MIIQHISNSGAAAYLPGAALAAAFVNPAGAPAIQPTPATPKPDEVRTSVDLINKTMKFLSRHLEFSFDEGARMNVVRVVDTQTNDLVRQFPSEEVVEIAKDLNKFQGLLLKEKA